MTMTRAELQDAAEVGLDVCISCGAAQPFAQVTDQECAVCGCPSVYPAEVILQAADFVTDEGPRDD